MENEVELWPNLSPKTQGCTNELEALKKTMMTCVILI